MGADLTAAAERFALTLASYGLQRMTARVMAALLFSQRESMTAGEIGEQLGVSSGAMSGALKQLTAMGMVERVPAPGSRRDHYSFRDGAWATLMSAQNAALTLMTTAADEGLAIAGDDTPAGRRLTEMRDFYRYMLDRLPALIDEWQRSRRTDGQGRL
ncbi:GbsR/MarR family transcriptional regulator [Virgisporangium ochraceum]|uniref:GbsR/MarR family transcriptional regulator n=1 Tax=Virgisporangium ochraceum TaxID=65505 RepID=UPI001EF39C4E|nr:MarR family transcriptional regulator [Virgisporangium ochraceum]